MAVCAACEISQETELWDFPEWQHFWAKHRNDKLRCSEQPVRASWV